MVYDAAINGNIVTQKEVSQVVKVTDNMLTLGVGKFQTYTMIAYVNIEPSTEAVSSSCEVCHLCDVFDEN